ncbi:hypothetical protein V6N12_005113 [Hibiscus sabdariffa]|uniref:RNase H type-1 domain-containing protein n=1 Tax=Hibiscus sabdariffa TaxID=183260 RepID=A0ABR2CNH5_9ROSI
MLVRDAFMAEALSYLQAIMFAREFGFTRVMFEGDSRTIIQKCPVDSNDFSLISLVITYINPWLGLSLAFPLVLHVVWLIRLLIPWLRRVKLLNVPCIGLKKSHIGR